MERITVRALRCGSIRVAPEYVSAGDGAAARAACLLAPVRRRVTLPVFAYLIRHPRGLILVDAGWSRAVSPRGEPDAAALSREVPGPGARLLMGWVEEGRTAAEQLRALGVGGEDLFCLLLTTLDADHVSGARELTGVKRVLIPQEELFWSYRAGAGRGRPLTEGLPVEPFWYHGSTDAPTGWACDLFGDGSVSLVNLPGHTNGTCGVLLRSGGRFLVLCSDAGYGKRSWGEPVTAGYAFNAPQARRTLAWLRAKSREDGCAGILAAHDPELAPGEITL